MSQTIRSKYLEALKTLNRWVIVSEWSEKVVEMYPEILKNAEEQASNYKNKSTGLREVTARISSGISSGAYVGSIEIDESERPRRIRYLTKKQIKEYEKNEIDEDLSPITRAEKIRNDEKNLSSQDKYRLNELESITTQLRTIFHFSFELEHAKSLLNPDAPGRHHPDNIQILTKFHNRIKNKSNWKRFTIEEQIEYIKFAVSLQKIVSKKLSVDIEDNVIDQIIERLKKVF